MAWSWPNLTRKRAAPIAIDFGSRWLKLLQIVPGNPPQLVAAAAAEVPEQARRDATQRWRFLAATLRDLLASRSFKGRRAICSLPAAQTLVQNFELNRDEAFGQDTASLVADQLRRRLNVDPSRMIIRHYDLGSTSRQGASLQHVLCIAASRETVMQHIELCAHAKLDVIGMHSEPTAILHAFGAINGAGNGQGGGDDDQQQAVCHIDLGASTTKLTITHGPHIVLAKTVQADAARLAPEADVAGGSGALEGVETAHGALSSVEAMPAGAPHQGEAGETGLAMLNVAAGAESEAPAEQAAPTASPASVPVTPTVPADETLECLTEELQMCLRYHQSLFPNKAVRKLVFLGGAARQVQTCQRIARSVRIAAQLGDPVARLTRLSAASPPLGVDFNQPQPGWAVPFGLSHCEANL